MKALILSGGKATRLRPITYTSAKQLVPVANKPVLFYAIESVVGAGIRDVGIVVGHTKDDIRAAVRDGSAWGIKVTYIEQDEPRGLAHAVKISREFIGDERFVLYLGDNFIQEDIRPLAEEFARGSANAQILLTHVPNPSEMGVAVLDNGRVARLVEKPKDPPSDLGIVGIYFFDQHIFEATENIKPSWRNELEITDAIQYLIDHGLHVKPYIVRGRWIDTGKKDDLLEVNRVVLADLRRRVEGMVDSSSRLIGEVVIEPGARVENSEIRGPAIVGANSYVADSYVGPFTSIYHDVVILNSEIEHSIVLENARIEDFRGRIDQSLIGRNVEIRCVQRKPHANTFMLGDHSRLELH